VLANLTIGSIPGTGSSGVSAVGRQPCSDDRRSQWVGKGGAAVLRLVYEDRSVAARLLSCHKPAWGTKRSERQVGCHGGRDDGGFQAAELRWVLHPSAANRGRRREAWPAVAGPRI
jgi:hypothetical protein